jgi:hypothetical protein
MNHTGRRTGFRPVAAANKGASGSTRRALYSADPMVPEFKLSNPLINPRALRQHVYSTAPNAAMFSGQKRPRHIS